MERLDSNPQHVARSPVDALPWAADVDPFHPGFHVSARDQKRGTHTAEKLGIGSCKHQTVKDRNRKLSFFLDAKWWTNVLATRIWEIKWAQELWCSVCQCHIELVVSQFQPHLGWWMPRPPLTRALLGAPARFYPECSVGVEGSMNIFNGIWLFKCLFLWKCVMQKI